jgi:hypothetical protein
MMKKRRSRDGGNEEEERDEYEEEQSVKKKSACTKTAREEVRQWQKDGNMIYSFCDHLLQFMHGDRDAPPNPIKRTWGHPAAVTPGAACAIGTGVASPAVEAREYIWKVLGKYTKIKRSATEFYGLQLFTAGYEKGCRLLVFITLEILEVHNDEAFFAASNRDLEHILTLVELSMRKQKSQSEGLLKTELRRATLIASASARAAVLTMVPSATMPMSSPEKSIK